MTNAAHAVDEPTLDDWFTTDEVADRYNVSRENVLRMCREDRLRNKKKGWVYLIHRSWLPANWPPPPVT